MIRNFDNNGSRIQQSGFTLLELIVSITILSLVTVLIGSGFRLAFDSWEKGENETEWTQRLRVLSGLLSQQLKSVYPYTVGKDDDKAFLFRGERDSVTFVTAMTGPSSGGFKWVRYSYKDEALLYKEGLLPDKEFEEKLEGKEEIIDSVKDVKFEYYSTEDSDWKESWESGEKLPGAVRVSIADFGPLLVNMPSGSHDEKEQDADRDEEDE